MHMHKGGLGPDTRCKMQAALCKQPARGVAVAINHHPTGYSVLETRIDIALLSTGLDWIGLDPSDHPPPASRWSLAGRLPIIESRMSSSGTGPTEAANRVPLLINFYSFYYSSTSEGCGMI